MSKLKDAIRIEYDRPLLSPWGTVITAELQVAAESVVDPRATGEMRLMIVEELKQRVLELVYGELIGEMQAIRHGLYDLMFLAGPGGQEASRKAMEAYQRAMELMR